MQGKTLLESFKGKMIESVTMVNDRVMITCTDKSTLNIMTPRTDDNIRVIVDIRSKDDKSSK